MQLNRSNFLKFLIQSELGNLEVALMRSLLCLIAGEWATVDCYALSNGTANIS
ncbi:hypothetical protein [Nostoc sp.]|uniref:hypothetical protein n=1 Tax=Nostoc sp. TaxID=1180 RepID=UPI002FF5F555